MNRVLSLLGLIAVDSVFSVSVCGRKATARVHWNYFDYKTMSKQGTWFYAVKKGRTPGIYHTWPECQAQVKEFSGPVFKKFSTYDDALDFINGGVSPAFTVTKPTSVTVSSGCRPTSNGAETGLVQAMQEQMGQMQGEILALRSEVNQLTRKVAALDNTVFQAPGSKRSLHTSSRSAENSTSDKQPKFDYDKENFTGNPFPESLGSHVYTDGGCFDNGRNGARAGIGVYWGEGDPDNVSERLSGRPTNNRAEIHAAVRAIQIAKQRGLSNLVLHTDSQFVINSITKWIKGWKKNGWVLTTGKPVINRADFEQLDEELQGINVKWKYVRGHSGNPGNEAVDRLAKQGAAQTS